MMLHRFTYCLLLASLFLACGEAASPGEAAATSSNGVPAATTVYLVRHAEKDLQDPSDDPPLTPEGKARAAKLAVLLKDVFFDGIFSTGYDRNLSTVMPLARQKNLDITPYEWYEWQPLIERIRSAPGGQTFLICGHGDNLLPMIKVLGARPPLDALGNHEYDKLFVVSFLPEGSEVEMQTF